jgi:hypothetical protein
MNIGIYRLYWGNIPDSTYIGQSIDLKSRIKNHIQKLRSKTHPNYKISALYKHYGTPELEILEYCAVDELYNKEVYWVNKFNSIKLGLNIAEPGCVGYGENHGSSVYSKLQYLKVFRCLYLVNNTLTYRQIAEKLNVSEHIVNSISKGTSHLWLKTCYPLQYYWMKQKDRSQHKLRLRPVTSTVISPTGKEYVVSNIREFARINDLNNGHLSRLLRGKTTQHKGWKLMLPNSA